MKTMTKREWKTCKDKTAVVEEAIKAIETALKSGEVDKTYKELALLIDLHLDEELHIMSMDSETRVLTMYPLDRWNDALARIHRARFGFSWADPGFVGVTNEQLAVLIGPIEGATKELVTWCGDVFEFADGATDGQMATELVRYAKGQGTKVAQKKARQVVAAMQGGPFPP